jgi:hypothetical protein
MTSSTTDEAPARKPRKARKDLHAIRSRAFVDKPVRMHLAVLAEIVALVGACALTRRWIALSPVAAVATWLAVTALMAAGAYMTLSPRARENPGEGIVWEEGDPVPDGISPATIAGIGEVFRGIFPARRYKGAWLEIAACPGPGRHGMCRNASATPGGAGMIRVVLGSHYAERPECAAFIVAHEVRHPAGPGLMFHLLVLAGAARAAAWGVVGWALPWPWLLVAVVAIQAAFIAVSWAAEFACDVGAARAQGRSAALAGLTCLQDAQRQPSSSPLWRRLVVLVLSRAGLPTAHPPFWLRNAMIRLAVKG